MVHRQTASAVVQHMSLGVYGFGCEDSLNHLLNYVWPNVFETSPHVIQAVMGALEGLRVALGPCRMLQYCLQVGTRVRIDVRAVGLERMVHRYVSLDMYEPHCLTLSVSAGSVPSSPEGERRLLEDLQLHLYWFPGRPDCSLPTGLQRWEERLRPLWARIRFVNTLDFFLFSLSLPNPGQL